MSDIRLAAFNISMTDEQKALMNQLFEKSWDSFIAVTDAGQGQIPNEHGTTREEKGLANVLYEADTKLFRSIEDRPDVSSTVEKEFARREWMPNQGLRVDLADTLRAGFGGVIATAAVW